MLGNGFENSFLLFWSPNQRIPLLRLNIMNEVSSSPLKNLLGAQLPSLSHQAELISSNFFLTSSSQISTNLFRQVIFLCC